MLKSAGELGNWQKQEKLCVHPILSVSPINRSDPLFANFPDQAIALLLKKYSLNCYILKLFQGSELLSEKLKIRLNLLTPFSLVKLDPPARTNRAGEAFEELGFEMSIHLFTQESRCALSGPRLYLSSKSCKLAPLKKRRACLQAKN